MRALLNKLDTIHFIILTTTKPCFLRQYLNGNLFKFKLNFLVSFVISGGGSPYLPSDPTDWCQNSPSIRFQFSLPMAHLRHVNWWTKTLLWSQSVPCSNGLLSVPTAWISAFMTEVDVSNRQSQNCFLYGRNLWGSTKRLDFVLRLNEETCEWSILGELCWFLFWQISIKEHVWWCLVVSGGVWQCRCL